MFARYASAVTTGTLVTFSLLYVMQSLLSMQPAVLSDPPPRLAVDWIKRKLPDEPPQPKEVLPDREDLTDVPQPPAHRLDEIGATNVRVPMASPPSGPVGGLHQEIRLVDGPLVALVRVRPVYPAIAIRKGMNGHVIVQFDVLADGTVANVTVVESSDGVFNNAAIQAARRFRFRPRVVDGVPLVTTGVQNLFRFEMQD